jgi:AraC-like DNA-binding protein
MKLFLIKEEWTKSLAGYHFIFNSTCMNKPLDVLSRQLQDSQSLTDMMFSCNNFFLSCLLLNDEDDSANRTHIISMLTQCNSYSSIEQLAASACMSVKTFERKFIQQAGVTPKMFARIVRFSKALALKDSNTCRSWTSIAHTCGYFDQTHFIKEFKLFTGETPSIFFKNSLAAG